MAKSKGEMQPVIVYTIFLRKRLTSYLVEAGKIMIQMLHIYSQRQCMGWSIYVIVNLMWLTFNASW